MGKPVKRKLRGKRLVALNLFLILIAIAYFGYRPVLRSFGNFLVIHDVATPSDAIIVLAGGDPGRALEAANLYKAKMGRYVVITTELPPAMYEQAKKDGVTLFLSYENYLRVLEGYGVPAENIFRLEEPVADTLDEITHVREFVKRKGWNQLLIVTSNFHTRRSRMVSRYVFDPSVHVAVVSSHDNGFDPDTWWTTQSQARTFAIESEKLVTYTIYIWPRMLWKK